MRFLDLNTGHTFDALWSVGQTNGYTFWFPTEQSVNITYTMPICMLTDSATPIELEVEENEVFRFIDSTTTTTCQGFAFGLPEYSYTKITDVEQISDSLYAHKVYVSASSEAEGEFVTTINIKGHGFIKVGADFYGENEALRINLSNFGVEIPDTIQKTIYDSNVHEDHKDNILLNRKFKELMSNYWDVIANRGSYKSLTNSLAWFEWGDVLRIREMWKRDVVGKPMYDKRRISSLLEDKYVDSMGLFNRTTYLSLTAALVDDSDDYDADGNPKLQDIAVQWTKEDLSLKLSLLNEFFSTFFLPIHLSIFQACVEDVVFTNTIKSITGGMTARQDVFGNFDYVECNVEDGATYKISNVRAQVTADTVFGVTTDMDTRHTHFGVDRFPSEGMVDEESLPTFVNQYYTGPGVIVPVRFTIKTNEPREFLKYTSVTFTPDGQTERDTIVFNQNFFQRSGKIHVEFNILSKVARDYDMVFNFILSSSKTLTRRIQFSTIDVDNLSMSIYRIVAKDNKNDFTYEDFYTTDMNDYYFKIQNTPPMTYKQYLPYVPNPGDDYKGIRLNRIIAVDTRGLEYDLPRIRLRMMGYLLFNKYDEDGNIKTIIGISKKFNAPIPDGLAGNYPVIKNDLGFFPQFHTIERIGGNTIEDYTVSQYDALCVIPEIHKYGNTYERFRYGHLIDGAEWEFINRSENITTTHPSSARVPYIASNDGKIMKDGFYDVVFRYRIAGEQKELRLDSAFRKKTI